MKRAGWMTRRRRATASRERSRDDALADRGPPQESREAPRDRFRRRHHVPAARGISARREPFGRSAGTWAPPEKAGARQGERRHQEPRAGRPLRRPHPLRRRPRHRYLLLDLSAHAGNGAGEALAQLPRRPAERGHVAGEIVRPSTRRPRAAAQDEEDWGLQKEEASS